LDLFAQWLTRLFFLVFMVQLVYGLKIVGIKPGFSCCVMIVYVAFTFRDPLQFYRDLYYMYANAENVFMAYLTATIVAAVVWLRVQPQENSLAMVVIFAVALGLIKLEGAIAAVFLLLLLLVLGRKELTPSKWAGLLGGIGLAVALPASWMYWIAGHGFEKKLSHLATGVTPAKFFQQVVLIGQNILLNNMVILFLLVGLSLLLFGTARKWERTEKFLLGAFLFLLVFSAFSSIGWPADKVKDIFSEVFPRLFLHATPALVLLWASRLDVLKK